MKNKNLCLERDGNRCRTCGSANNLEAVKLVDRDGEVSNHLSNLITLCDKCSGLRFEIKKNSRYNRSGILLCGGKGTRLYPLTRTTNKHVLPVGNVPGLFYGIKTLRELGVKRILVVVDQFASSIMEVAGSGKQFGVELSYKIQDGAFGIGDALYVARDFVRPGDEIFCMLGDNIFDTGEFAEGFNWKDDNKKACVFVKKVPNPQDYGVALLENGEIKSIVEKPKEFISDLGVVGLYVYRDSGVFDVINNSKPSNRGELEISTINDYYAEQGQLQHREINGYWGDYGGSIRRYAECNLHGAKEANITAEEIDNFRSIVFDNK